MSGSIIRNVLRKKSPLFKNLSQILIIRNKQSTFVSKDRSITEADNDEENKPIKFSMTKAYKMRPDEHRYVNEGVPWYQSDCIMLSITVFLIYFCILREENDIDIMLNYSLDETLKKAEKEKIEESKKNSQKK